MGNIAPVKTKTVLALFTEYSWRDISNINPIPIILCGLYPSRWIHVKVKGRDREILCRGFSGVQQNMVLVNIVYSLIWVSYREMLYSQEKVSVLILDSKFVAGPKIGRRTPGFSIFVRLFVCLSVRLSVSTMRKRLLNGHYTPFFFKILNLL